MWFKYRVLFGGSLPKISYTPIFCPAALQHQLWLNHQLLLLLLLPFTVWYPWYVYDTVSYQIGKFRGNFNLLGILINLLAKLHPFFWPIKLRHGDQAKFAITNFAWKNNIPWLMVNDCSNSLATISPPAPTFAKPATSCPTSGALRAPAKAALEEDLPSHPPAPPQ